jgi:hypothetical protein
MVNRGSGSSVPVKVARNRKYEEIDKEVPPCQESTQGERD